MVNNSIKIHSHNQNYQAYLYKSMSQVCVHQMYAHLGVHASDAEEGGHALSVTNFIYVICVAYIPKCSKIDEHTDYLVCDSSEDTFIKKVYVIPRYPVYTATLPKRNL